MSIQRQVPIPDFRQTRDAYRIRRLTRISSRAKSLSFRKDTCPIDPWRFGRTRCRLTSATPTPDHTRSVRTWLLNFQSIKYLELSPHRAARTRPTAAGRICGTTYREMVEMSVNRQIDSNSTLSRRDGQGARQTDTENSAPLPARIAIPAEALAPAAAVAYCTKRCPSEAFGTMPLATSRSPLRRLPVRSQRS
jgi:hypothetical protein